MPRDGDEITECDELRIVPFAEQHQDALRRLIDQQKETHGSHDDEHDDGLSRRLYSAICKEGRSEAFMVENSAGQVLATATYYDCYTSEGPGVYLEDIVTSKEFRTRGIGQFAMSGLARLAMERGARQIVWECAYNNHVAHRFYDRLDCERCDDRHTQRLNGVISPSSELAFFKRLHQIRPPCPQDAAGIAAFMASEKAPGNHHEWIVNNDNAHLVPVVAVNRRGAIVGMALTYRNFSTFRVCNGLHIEAVHTNGDLTVAGALIEHCGDLQAAMGWNGHTDMTLTAQQKPFMEELAQKYGFAPLAYDDDKMVTRRIGGESMKALAHRFDVPYVPRIPAFSPSAKLNEAALAGEAPRI